MDEEAANALLRRAAESHSDALVVLVDGEPLVEWPAPNRQVPIETMSITKSFVGLAIGYLVTEGRLSLDDRVAQWLREWEGRPGYQDITIRHLLEMTSGLDAPPTRPLYDRNDFLASALETPLVSTPGEVHLYNNSSINLLPAIVDRVTGQAIDTLLSQRLFGPLGIEQTRWERDGTGMPLGLSGLALRASDLARIGVVLLDGGRRGDRQLIPEDWITASQTPTERRSEYGRLWWILYDTEQCVVDEALLDQWAAAGVDAAVVAALRPLGVVDLKSEDRERAFEALGGPEVGRERWRGALDGHARQCRPIGEHQVGFAANGWLGQQLVILPERRIVAVRQMRMRPEHQQRGDSGVDTYADFVARTLDL